MSVWLTVVGGLPSGALAPTAPPGVLAASAVFGPARLLEAAHVEAHRRRPWPSPLEGGIAALLSRRGEPTTVLASGDPLHYGIAGTLLRHVLREEMAVHPAPSAFALAAAALKWPLQDVTTLSLHRAPAETVLHHVAAGKRLLCLTRDGDGPAAIAAALTRAGWGDSELAVLEALGGPEANAVTRYARALEGPYHPLNVVAITCVGAAHGAVPADALAHDGCVTSQEVRCLTLAALGRPGHLWDVGAGSGAIAIDWCRMGGTATLFERHPGRLANIAHNLQTTGIDAAVLAGDAAHRLDAAAPPDRVFLGGGVSTDLFDAVWARLPADGVFVSNAVTLEAQAATLARRRAHGGRLTEIAIAREAPLGSLTALRPQLKVLQWRAVKA